MKLRLLVSCVRQAEFTGSGSATTERAAAERHPLNYAALVKQWRRLQPTRKKVTNLRDRLAHLRGTQQSFQQIAHFVHLIKHERHRLVFKYF